MVENAGDLASWVQRRVKGEGKGKKPDPISQGWQKHRELRTQRGRGLSQVTDTDPGLCPEGARWYAARTSKHWTPTG